MDQATVTSPFAGLDFVAADVPLGPLTWFGIGGPARHLVRPRSVEELQTAAARCRENGIKTYVLGLGANVLVSDDGVDGAVFVFDQPHFKQWNRSGTNVVASAGVNVQHLARDLVREGIGGLEPMAGIFGTAGGLCRMNAGGRWGSFGDHITRVTVMDAAGEVFVRERSDLRFEYRRTNIIAPYILSVELELFEDDPAELGKRMKEIFMVKNAAQPLNTKSAGCMFKNPEGASAGQLIDSAGCKGLRLGAAEVSEKHANFVIAHPHCTAADIEAVTAEVQRRVHDKHGVMLKTEVVRWP